MNAAANCAFFFLNGKWVKCPCRRLYYRDNIPHSRSLWWKKNSVIINIFDKSIETQVQHLVRVCAHSSAYPNSSLQMLVSALLFP